jgi:hypothetical protein
MSRKTYNDKGFGGFEEHRHDDNPTTKPEQNVDFEFARQKCNNPPVGCLLCFQGVGILINSLRKSRWISSFRTMDFSRCLFNFKFK